MLKNREQGRTRGGLRGHAPQSSTEWFFNEKTGFVESALFSRATLFSLPEVFRGPQICQNCVGGRGSAPDSAGGAHDAPPDPLVGWGGEHPSPIPTPLGAFGSQLLWPPM